MTKISRKIRRNAKRNGANGKSKINVEREVIKSFGNYFNGDKEKILTTFDISKDLTKLFCEVVFKDKMIPKLISIGIEVEEDLILNPDFKCMVMDTLDRHNTISHYIKGDIEIEKIDRGFEITLPLDNESNYLEVLLFLAYDHILIEDMVNVNDIGVVWSGMGIQRTDIIGALVELKRLKYTELNEGVIKLLTRVLATPSYDAIVLFVDDTNNVA